MDLLEPDDKITGQRGPWEQLTRLVRPLRSFLNRLSSATFAILRQQSPLGWLLRYGFAVAAVVAALAFRLRIEAWVGPGLATYITFYPAVMVAALLGGFGSGLVATAAASLLAVFFIIPPVGQLSIALPVDRVGLVVFAGMGLFMSLVALFYQRNQEKAAAYDREQELREINREKAFLANFLENANQPFAVGFPDGHLGLVNQAFEQLTGYTAAELRDIDWMLTLTPPEWREIESEKLAELARLGQPIRYEKEYLRKDGVRVPIEVQVNLKRGATDQPEYYYSFLTDITELKRAEAILRDNELKASALINSADESIWLFSLAGDILAANNTAACRLGMSVEAVVGKKWQDLIPPELAAARKAKVEEVICTEKPVRFEDERAGVVFEHSAYPVRNLSGTITAVAFFSRDITERKRAEEAWRQSQQDLARAQQVGQIGSWRLDVRHNVLTWSAENHRIFGIPEGTPLTYEIFLAAVHPDDRAYVDSRWQAGLRGESYDLEHRLVVAGQVKWVREKAFLEFGTDGSLLGGFGITQDISARKQAETEIFQLNEQLGRKIAELEAANRELEGFTYSVSHDLRAPIRHIAGFTKLLVSKIGPELNEDGLRYLAFIVDAANRLGILVDELLEFSRMGRAEIGVAEVDLGPLIGMVVENFQKKADARQIEWRVGESPMVHGDATMLRFVVENLIANAVKFTSTRELARIEIGSGEDENNYIVFVKDNGVGFDMAYYDKLFGVFQRLHSKEAFEGTGIGLANVQRIIHRHGGKVWAESKIDEGATFFFSLPKETKGII